jgi:DNA topoisomerase-1
VTDGTTNASLRRGDDPDAVTLERAAELIADRRAAGPAKRSTGAKKAGARKATGAKKAGARKATGAKKATAAKRAPGAATRTTNLKPASEPDDW